MNGELRVPDSGVFLSHEKMQLSRAELVEGLEKYSEVFGCYLILNCAGVIQYINLKGIDILDSESLRQHGWRLECFLSENDRDVFNKFLMRVFNNQTQEHCEVLLQSSVGSKLWVRMEGKASNDGNTCHVVLIDITDHKQMEVSLSASEFKYRALFANMSTAFSYHKFIRDKHGNTYEPILIQANDAYGTMLGRPVCEIIGKKCSEINEAGTAPLLDWERLCTDVVIKSQPACFDYYDTSLKRWLSVIAYSPAPEHMALVYVDITKTKIAEKQVAESEKRYRNLVQGTDVLIMIINERSEINFINEYGLAFLGFSAEELIGKSVFDTIVPVFDTPGSSIQDVFNRFKARPGQKHRHTLENITGSGGRVWIDWTSHSLNDPKTGEHILICVGVDVTESKRSEQESLRRMAQQRQRDFFNDSIKRGIGVGEWLSAAKLMGIEIQPPFILSLVEIPPQLVAPGVSEQVRIECQHAIDSLIETLQYVGAGVTWHAADGIAILRPVSSQIECSPSERSRTIAADIVKIASRYWNGLPLRMGISRFSQDQSIAEMYTQAQAAITYGPILHPDQSIHCWHDLGCYQFILNDLESEQSRRFVKDALGPLMIENFTEDPGELLLTLGALLTGDSAQVVAKKLHIHPQTVAFRKKKIEKCLNVDLNCMETRLKLTIATRLLSFMEKNVRMAHLVG